MIDSETVETLGGAQAGQTLEVIAGYKVHPLASRFPLIEGTEFEDLVDAAARAGRLYPVETHRGFLIDGRNRLRVQEELRGRGIEIDLPVVEWEPTGDETVEEHIWSVNANRRHQTADQRAALALVFLPSIRAARQARQEASRFGKNGGDTAEMISPPPDAAATNPGRSSAAKDAASSVGHLAALANISHYKASQAVALYKAVEEGEVSETEIDAVLAGDKPLRDAVPHRRKGGRRRPRPLECEEAYEEVSVFDPNPIACEVEVRRRWEEQKSEFAVADHHELRRLFMKVIHEEQRQFDR